MSDKLSSFNAFMGSVEDGSLHHDLTEALVDLVGDLENAAACSGGKAKGKITITIDLIRDAGTVDAKGDFKITKPKVVRPKSVYFVTPDNHLTLRNPKQPDLPFRDVSADRDVRTVS